VTTIVDGRANPDLHSAIFLSRIITREVSRNAGQKRLLGISLTRESLPETARTYFAFGHLPRRSEMSVQRRRAPQENSGKIDRRQGYREIPNIIIISSFPVSDRKNGCAIHEGDF
jgi:hypothetical protein